MNKIYGSILALVFLMGIGLFNISLGIGHIRKKSKSTVWGIFYILIGLPALILPIAIFIFLKRIGQF